MQIFSSKADNGEFGLTLGESRFLNTDLKLKLNHQMWWNALGRLPALGATQNACSL